MRFSCSANQFWSRSSKVAKTFPVGMDVMATIEAYEL